MSRFFSGSQRTALFLAADGKCQMCGEPLAEGWHADHRTPHSAGGPTDVTNGQALCPPCNLKKGGSVNRYEWQDRAIKRYDGMGRPTDFLVTATPGAGKTRFSLKLAAGLIDAGKVSQLIVVVPTSHLRTQWEQAGKVFGLALAANYENRHGVIPADEHGIIVTYAAVAAAPALYRTLVGRRPTLVILDEVHHAGDDDRTSWGPSLRHAFELADRRLLLSGTPFRSNGTPIPFVRYDENRTCVVDFAFDYRDALQANVVRPVTFDLLDGKMQWGERGVDDESTRRERAALLSDDADEQTLSRAMAVAIQPDGEWAASVLQRAVQRLDDLRHVTPDAGGLVIADDQFKARAYAEHLERLTGEQISLAISDDPDASGVIARFAAGSSKWLVAVRMVSEGVDIPRLLVGVYATRTRTEMFFKQVVGRFVRTRGEDDTDCAIVYLPAIPPLRVLAAEMESVQAVVLAEQQAGRGDQDPSDDKEPQGIRQLTIIDPGLSGAASLHSSVLHGEAFSEAELRAAADLSEQASMPGNVTPTQIARLLRQAGVPRVVGEIRIAEPVGEPSLREQKAAASRLINRRVNAWCRDGSRRYQDVHVALNRAVSERSIKAATLESLRSRLDLLDRWGCP